ncbi:hypothetical protein JXB02_06460 [Candidatus Woesearchaeota archaeon]|nr:hypothetical protein [Candidatus Woesearchaeota archaeon]
MGVLKDLLEPVLLGPYFSLFLFGILIIMMNFLPFGALTKAMLMVGGVVLLIILSIESVR